MDPTSNSNSPSKMKQPPGLYCLFLTEMWERFSFHGMRALLVLYMTASQAQGGLEWDNCSALQLYSYYLGFAYLTPILGGYIADRMLGQKRTALIGGSVMALGHCMMPCKQPYFFFIAVGLVCLGNGFFKPNITALLGQLYQQGDPRRDVGYSIFYMGINIGAMLASLTNGLLQQHFGFSIGFLAAGAGMMIGLSILNLTPRGFLLPHGAHLSNESAIINEPIQLHHRLRMRVIAVMCLAATAFMLAFGQSGGLIHLFANKWTQREVYGHTIPAAFFLSLNPIFGLILAPVLSVCWLKMTAWTPSISQKLSLGLGFASLSFCLLWFVTPNDIMQHPYQCHSLWLVPFYALLTAAEICILPILWSGISKLSHPSWISSMMACALLAMGIGGYTAGQVASFVDTTGPKAIFGLISVVNAGVGLLLAKSSPLLKKWSCGIE